MIDNIRPSNSVMKKENAKQRLMVLCHSLVFG